MGSYPPYQDPRIQAQDETVDPRPYQGASLPPPPGGPTLTPPPKPGVMDQLMPYAASGQLGSAVTGPLGLLATAIGGLAGGSKGAKFGLGMLEASNKNAHEANARARERDFAGEQNRIKNVSARVERARRLGATDPRFAEIARKFDAAMQDGNFTAKEASSIAQEMDALPDVEGLLSQREADQKLAYQKALAEASDKLERSHNVDITPEGAPGPLNVNPGQALNYFGSQSGNKLRDQLIHAQINNINADNARADAAFKAAQAAKSVADDEAAIGIAADALASGQARNLTEAMAMMGSARNRGDVGVKIMAAMGDRIALPEKARTRVGEINSSIYTLDTIKDLMDKAVGSAEGSYVLDKYIASNAASISVALGEKGTKTEGDIKRALGLTPGWFETNVVPDLAHQRLELGRKKMLNNKAEVVRAHASTFGKGGDERKGGLPRPPAGPELPPPPSSNDPLGILN